MDTIILMTLVVIAILIILIIKEYNKIIKLQNKVKSSESGIDIRFNTKFSRMCKRICKTRKTASRKYYKTKNRICKKSKFEKSRRIKQELK